MPTTENLKCGQRLILVLATSLTFKILSPICAKILSTTLYAPLDLLTGYSTGCLSIAHFTGKIAIVAKIHMNVNWLGEGGAGFVKILSSRTLFKAVRKRLLEDNTFLITSDATTLGTHLFFLVTSRTRWHWAVAQYPLSELFYRFCIEPFCNTCGSNIIVIARIEFVGFLTAYA